MSRQSNEIDTLKFMNKEIYLAVFWLHFSTNDTKATTTDKVLVARLLPYLLYNFFWNITLFSALVQPPLICGKDRKSVV